MAYVGKKPEPLYLGQVDDLNVQGDAAVTGNLTVTGTTITMDSASVQTVDLGDNDKIRLGDADDAQIYHDGTNTIINNDTGNIAITGSNVGIGTSSPNKNGFSTSYAVTTLQGTLGGALELTDGTSNNLIWSQGDGLTIDADKGNADGSSYMRFRVDGSEAMRIDSSGYLIVGKQTSDDTNAGMRTNGNFMSVTRDGGRPVYLNRLTNDGDILEFAKDGTTVGSIASASGGSRLRIVGSGELEVYRQNSNANFGLLRIISNVTATGTTHALIYADGDIQNTNNSYTGFSDISIKENIEDASSQWDDIKAIQVRKYDNMRMNGARQIGVIAQEVEAAGMSGLVKEDEDGLKSVKYSILYMKAVKALQEAMERIETLETTQADLVARIEALEAN